jgi:hypothetical protein
MEVEFSEVRGGALPSLCRWALCAFLSSPPPG